MALPAKGSRVHSPTMQTESAASSETADGGRQQDEEDKTQESNSMFKNKHITNILQKVLRKGTYFYIN